MCEWGNTEPVIVEIPAYLSSTKQIKKKIVGVDKCIASLVQALTPLTIASCCGHGKFPGRIDLIDGRVLIIHDESNLVFEETIRQPYQDMAISGGFVHGHPIDTVYIRFERREEPPTTILLRPDELAAIAWIASGVLWSELMKALIPNLENA